MSSYLLKGGWQLKEKEFGHKAQESTEEWLSTFFFFKEADFQRCLRRKHT